MFICTGWHFAIAVVGILEYFKTKCFVHESKKENPKKLNKTNNIKHIVEETMQHDG